MDESSKAIVMGIGIFLGIVGLLFSHILLHLFFFMLNLLLYIVFISIDSSRITNVIGRLLIVSAMLSIIEIILAVIFSISINFTLLKISGYLSMISLGLFVIYHLYTFLKEILQSIEIKLKK